MQKGFKRVAPDLIRDKPGLTAYEYAEMALKQHLCGSDSKNPVFSLATTLMKEFREGRMPGIKAVKGHDNKLRYFPKHYDTNKQVASLGNDSPVTILLPTDVAKNVDMLVEIGKFTSRGEALIWLASEGIGANLQKLQDVEKRIQQIRDLKRSVSI